MSTLKLSFVIEAVDRATARVTAVNRAIDKVTEPVRRVRAAVNGLVNESGLSRLGQQWNDIGQRVGRVRELVGGVRNAILAAAAAGGALFFGLSKVAGRLDKAADDAKMLNVSVEWLQEMGQAAEQSGGSVDGMTDALRFLSKNMAEAMSGGKEQAQWFARVGIPLEKLKKMTLPQVFNQISDKFNQVGDAGQNAQKKIAVTQALMGRGGFEMVQFLNKGSKGINEIVASLRKSGTIVDKDTAESLADFNDTLAMLRGNLFATVAVIARAALPVVEKITKAVMGWSQGNRELMATRVQEFVEKLLARLPSIITGLGQVASGIGAVISVVDTVAQAMGGWETIIKLVAAAIALKLLIAIGSLGVALVGLWPTIIRIALALGSVLLPALASVVTGFAWMAGATISIVGSWLAVLVVGLATAAKAVWALSAALLANPITWIVLAIAAAAVLLYKYWEPISGFFQQLWADVGAVFSAGWALITGIFDGLWGGIKASFNAVFDWITGRIGAVANVIAGAVSKVASILPGSGAVGLLGGPAPAGGGMGSPLGAAIGLGRPAGAAGAPAGSAIARPAASQAKVGGTIKLEIDQDGRARVKELRSDNPDVAIDVYSGAYMAGGA
jgi:hypothetical protein